MRRVTRWTLGFTTLALTALALAGCGKDLSPAAPQAPVYTRESPPPFVRSADASASDFLTATWYTVASMSVDKGKSKIVAGSHYSLLFDKNSLTVSKLAVTIQELDPSLIEFQLGPHGSQFATPVTLTISYAGTNADPSSASYTPGALVFYYLNPATNIWEQVPGTNNATLKNYTVSLTHFSTYALAKVPPPGTGDW
jgi:hypothetical protein